MTNGTYTGQTDWRVGGVSKVYRSEVIPLSFEGRNKDVDRRSIVSRYGKKIVRRDLIDFAKDFDVEIANGRGATSLDNTFIRNDFVRKSWYTTDGNKYLKDFQKKINHIANLAINEEDYVVLPNIDLCYICINALHLVIESTFALKVDSVYL